MGAVALLDANVIWSAALRDTLLLAAEQGLYRPVWTRRILDEMGRSLKARRPELAARIDRTVSQMVEFFPDAACASHGIQTATPDEFLCQLWRQDARQMALVLVEQSTHLIKPPRTLRQLLDTLSRSVPTFVETAVKSGLLDRRPLPSLSRALNASALGLRNGRKAGSLSPREREVAALIAQGLSNAEIADRLVIAAPCYNGPSLPSRPSEAWAGVEV